MEINKDIKILFIDDQEDVAQKYYDHLKRRYPNVYKAFSGEEAYEIFKKVKPHIIFLDIDLPKISGLELLKIIRKTDNETSIVVLSSYSKATIISEAKKNNIYDYIIKPITRGELHKIIEDIANIK